MKKTAEEIRLEINELELGRIQALNAESMAKMQLATQDNALRQAKMRLAEATATAWVLAACRPFGTPVKLPVSDEINYETQPLGPYNERLTISRRFKTEARDGCSAIDRVAAVLADEPEARATMDAPHRMAGRVGRWCFKRYDHEPTAEDQTAFIEACRSSKPLV